MQALLTQTLASSQIHYVIPRHLKSLFVITLGLKCADQVSDEFFLKWTIFKFGLRRKVPVNEFMRSLLVVMGVGIKF